MATTTVQITKRIRTRIDPKTGKIIEEVEDGNLEEARKKRAARLGLQ